jgi:hypothetical protein
MKTVIFGFSTPKKQTIVSRLIRLVEGTPYSHAYMQFYAESLQANLIYQASYVSVHFTNMTRFCDKAEIIEYFEVPVPPEKEKELLKFCVDSVDTPYGATQLVGQAMARLYYNWFGKRIKNPLADGPKTEVCSELVGKAMIIIGLPVDASRLEFEGPKYLNNILRLHYGK